MRPVLLAYTLCFLYIGVLSWLSIQRHLNLLTQMHDLGIMAQSIWSVSQGYLGMPVSNAATGGEEFRFVSRLRIHGNFIFYLLAIPFAVVPGLVEYLHSVLLFGTSAACGLAGLGIFYFARHRLSGCGWLAVVIASAFWLNPRVHDANLYDFHVITFTTAFLVWMLYVWETGREKLGWVLFALALLCKEDVFLILTALGFGEVLWRDRKRGAWMIGVSLAYAAFYFGILQPFLTESGPALPGPAASRFEWLGEGVGGILWTFVTRPDLVFEGVFVESLPYPYLLWGYLFAIFGGAVAMFGGWRILLGAFPPLFIAMLAEGPNGNWMQRITGTYYWLTSIGLIYFATVEAIATWNSQVRRPLTVAYMFVGATVASVFLSQTPLGLTASVSDYRPNSAHRTSLAEVQKLVPDSAAVLAQNNIAAQFAKRRKVRTPESSFEPDRNAGGWDFFIVHLELHEHPNNWLFPAYFHLVEPEVPKLIRRFKRSPDWRCRYNENNFLVFEHINRGTDLDVNLEAAKSAILRLYEQMDNKLPWFTPRWFFEVEIGSKE